MTGQQTTISATEKAGNISVGAILILLYVACVSLVVIGFSAYVIRTDWTTSLSTNGGSIKDLDNLVYLIKRDQELVTVISEFQNRIVETDAMIVQHSQSESALRASLADREAEFAETISLAMVHIDGAAEFMMNDEFDAVTALTGDVSKSVNATSVRQALFMLPRATFRDDVDPQKVAMLRETTDSLTARMNDHVTRISQVKLELQTAESNTQRAHEARSHHVMSQNAQQQALNELREVVSVNSEHRARWIELSDGSWWNPMPRLVAAPTILLTLMATIAAGALGTLVSYSRTTFVQETKLRSSKLLINLGEGIAAAIGVFLFAGAGMLVLSQGGGQDGRLELSPYTVAFLAFLSGFMAESAFGKMSNFGKDLFGQKDTNASKGPPPDGE